MSWKIYRDLANEDFSKARGIATLQRLINLLTPWKQNLLKLDDVRSALAPQKEIYRGVRTVPIHSIIGSEGRYKDFTKSFLPKHEYLRDRWTSIDVAHHAQINLPPVELYEIGGIYFVRDGNHRVSVAKSMGVKDIDAVVTSLETKIRLDSRSITTEVIREQVIKYEQAEFYRITCFREASAGYNLVFTSTGQYREILAIITFHKQYLESLYKHEINIEEASQHWFLNVFYPIIRIIQKQKLLSRFPRRTADDLFVWVYKHWTELQKQNAHNTSLEGALEQYSTNFGKNIIQRYAAAISNIFRMFHRRQQ